jgi:hypothetical protein
MTSVRGESITWKDSPEVVEFMNSTKHHSATVEADILDAFEEAETLEEFKDSVKGKMEGLESEAGGIKVAVEEL